MKKYKPYLIIFALALLAIAVVFRFPKVRSVVTAGN